MEYLRLHSAWNIHWLDTQYKAWQSAPDQTAPDWSHFFRAFTQAEAPHFKRQNSTLQGSAPAPLDLKLFKALNSYRHLGHLQAKYNPLVPPKPCRELSLEALGWSREDLGLGYDGASLGAFPHVSTVHSFLKCLESAYCGSLAYVYTHIEDSKRLEWLEEAAEGEAYKVCAASSKSQSILQAILKVELFEAFLDQKFRGQKRFSIEGLSVVVPALLELLELSAQESIQKVFIAASHRGRLNILANVLNKPLDRIFREFLEGHTEPLKKGGDVKYHLGWDGSFRNTEGTVVDVHLSPNPSHLEAIYPVLQGKTKAWQNLFGPNTALSIVLHGEAAFAGQGIVSETLNCSQLTPYDTQGAVHLILNNQIGFTTPACQGRSSLYSGAIAKSLDAPLLLVNSEDVFAVLKALKIAFAYRQRWHKSIFIELYGYRKEGHNEIDEPSFTQYSLYQDLARRPRLSEIFIKDMAAKLDIDLTQQATHFRSSYTDSLEGIFRKLRFDSPPPKKTEDGLCEAKMDLVRLRPEHSHIKEETPRPISAETLKAIAKALWTVPPGFHIHPKLRRQLQAKKEAFPAEIDWSLAEALALGSLLHEGYSVRLSGQDSERGTFSQRHAVWHDTQSTSSYTPLKALAHKNQTFTIHNTPLSEAAVLGFEYGYSLVHTRCLTIWEAQFGDFANGAQVMIDQLITSGEAKWGQKSRLVLLLPHGHQGQGPDHSSARLERFLQACADDNLQICSPTTPAQYFHLLRRQMHQEIAKPLVIMIPKNLFRHKGCTSSLEELSASSFKAIIPSPMHHPEAKTVLLCTGKIYYELLAYKAATRPIIRLEQLYPLDSKGLEQVLSVYATDSSLVWVQEEPQNMGAWSYIASLIQHMGRTITYVGRPASASAACGSLSLHQLEQESLLQEAFSV